MDITTILGFVGAATLLGLGLLTEQITPVFLNFHGLFLVLGGTAVAMLINTPVGYLTDALAALGVLFKGDGGTTPRSLVPLIVSVSQGVHARGVNALSGIDAGVAGGFLARAAQVAMEFKEPQFVQDVLEIEANQAADRQNEVVNVFRTMAVLAPMFGLVGTLIGIVDTLRHISNPEQVGPAMAVAVTTAFYGILLANLVAVPLAGKLRIRFNEDYQSKLIIIDGVVQMLKGTVPVVLERRLQSYLREGRS